MIIPEIQARKDPAGNTWIEIITLVTGVSYEKNYTVWQVVGPDGKLENWGCCARLRTAKGSARRCIKNEWKKRKRRSPGCIPSFRRFTRSGEISSETCTSENSTDD
jgi:hypothetical protein